MTFLGTGPAEAIPRAGHHDALCVDAQRGGKSRRTRSSCLVQEGRTSVLLDAGPDIQQQLSPKYLASIAAVFITHAHRDATGGLSWVPKEVPVYRPGVDHPVQVGPLSIVPVPVLHAFDDQVQTRGFVINGRFGYVSDCRDIPQGSRGPLMNLDVLALDAAAYLGTKIPTHLSVEQSLQLAIELNPRRLYLTQVGHTFPPHRLAEQEVRRYAKAHGCPFPVRLAYDGLRVTV